MPRATPDPVIAADRGRELGRIADLFGSYAGLSRALALVGHEIRPDNVKRYINNSEGRCASEALMAAAARAETELARWTIGRDSNGGECIVHLLEPYFVAPLKGGQLDEKRLRWLGARNVPHSAAIEAARAFLKHRSRR